MPLASLVDLFFVLSGFVLMPSLAASEKERFGFFKKRLLRFYSVLIPAFLFFVFLNYVDFEGGKFTLTNYSITQIVGAFFLLQMFYAKCVWVLGVLWSLSAELLVNVNVAFHNVTNILFCGVKWKAKDKKRGREG
jgi:peptidoglycan/LPS O-acetylase OafA/YrhL